MPTDEKTDDDNGSLPDDMDDIEDPHVGKGDAQNEELHKARLESYGDVHEQAWQAVLEEMEVLATDRKNDGWETHTVIAAHTDAVSKDMGQHDRFGLHHIVPNNHADVISDIYDESEFSEFLAYGKPIESFVFLVTEFIDPDRQRSIFVACSYDPTRGKGMVENGEEYGCLNTYFKTIDGTILGKFTHERWEPLVGKEPEEATEL
ncbi:hypothetical protein ACFQJ7_03515 [Halovenus rubra]|uniref:SnoaL-like domain-containing protein n=2 Tax=Halovenus rubra TaxID=869890 RepID=A0ABD5X3J6_9EURY|nr:hypothetical protein [Halovenus rubra]